MSPTGDAVPAPDLLAARGEIVELGTSVRFTLRFAAPLVVPDDGGKPFRVDIVLFDPEVPPTDVGFYRGMNRLLRYDAVAEPITSIVLLPEAAESRFIAPTIEGGRFVMQVPGRTLVEDEDRSGTSPALERLRWGVVVRDERACDLLGDGRPVRRLVLGAEAPSPPPASSSGDEGIDRSAGAIGLMAGVGLVLGIGGFLLRRSSRRAAG